MTGGAGETVVRIEPLGETVTLRTGEPLMRAAVRAGLRWPTMCNGLARCGVCHVDVVEASTPLPAIGEQERRTLRLVPPHRLKPNTRLACQLVPGGGTLIVERTGVARNDGNRKEAG